MSNLEFQTGDSEALKELCARARKIAKNDPCVTKDQALNPRYAFRFGPWNLWLTVDAFTSPKVWHASAAGLTEVDEIPITLPGGLIAKIPQDALISAFHWSNDQNKQADFLLGELLGPMIKEKHQEVQIHRGLFALHWLTKYDV